MPADAKPRKLTSRELVARFKVCQEYGVSELDERPDGTMRVVFGNPAPRAVAQAGEADGDEAGDEFEDPRFFLERKYAALEAAKKATQ